MAHAIESSLIGQVAIVTGAARGIGFAIAQELAGAGSRVELVDLREEDVSAAASTLAGRGAEAAGLAADISRVADVEAMVRSAIERWGRVDILVNNAGICPVTPLAEITEDEWERVLAVNLKGPFLCAQAVAPGMLARGRGKIINIASSAGQMGGIAVGLHYSASKAGILGLTKALARMLAPAIQVNAVSPGTSDSEMTRGWRPEVVAGITQQIPLRRLGVPADTAAAVLFLASAAADYITGQTLSVNGGLFMS